MLKTTVTPSSVNNAFYDDLGERWYHDDRHAIALLRAESHLKTQYVRDALTRHGLGPGARVLDVACGAGLVTIPLAEAGFHVDGVDLSEGSLVTAAKRAAHLPHLRFQVDDALALSAAAASYDAVLLLDFLEHVARPEAAIKEAVRILRPGGLIVIHTFNRTLAARLLAIKALEWLTLDCPDHVHVFDLFLKPQEIATMLAEAGTSFFDVRGLRPKLRSKAFWKSVWKRRLEPGFSFVHSRSLAVGYIGCGVKFRGDYLRVP